VAEPTPIVSNTTPLINLAGVGTGAVLIEAKRAGLIIAVAPLHNTMVAQGRYISERLRATLLAAAGETNG
jgi:predicted nucleic acid-binding protein